MWLLACAWLDSEPTPPAGGQALPLVALITVDTWRADHLGPEWTENLWQLAEEGERYTHAYSPIGLTTPAHVTMFTGLMPWEHGVEGNNHHGYALSAGVEVLPERYQDWARGAFVSAYPAGPEGGLQRGWQVYDGPKSGERPGSETISRALAWLPDDQPALLFVHVYEPHGPYQGRGETERERYGEEVRRVDDMLEPLIQVLRDRDATVVITSDHGEVLDEERCSFQHERSISDHVLRVPLIRWGPSFSPKVIERPVGLADVPALLAGKEPAGRPFWLAESGMCEPDCAPGCAPSGLMGRDRVVLDESGRWVDRPGKGRFSVGSPKASLATQLDQIPAVAPPSGAGSDAARSLGYIDGPF